MTTTTAKPTTLSQAFLHRVATSASRPAYRYFDKTVENWNNVTWQAIADEVKRWQSALRQTGLTQGMRVAIMLRNSPSWVIADQASLGLGLVNVPLFTDDRPDNVAYILAQTDTQILFIDGILQWKRLYPQRDAFTSLTHIISLTPIDDATRVDERLISLEDWLANSTSVDTVQDLTQADDLASIVYTSGTTGRPKGVMLTHRNLLQNAQSAYTFLGGYTSKEEIFFSFLPLSHTLERTAGYYLPMLFEDAMVVYARSIQQIASDLLSQRPTIMISVPRIYEQVYGKIQNQLQRKSFIQRYIFDLTLRVGWQHFEYRQGRTTWHPSLLLYPLLRRLVAQALHDKLGGRLKLAVCGGAAMSPQIGKFFLSLDMTILQGYGLTEASPVISVNRPDDNIPASIGTAMSGIEVKLGEGNELLTRSPCIMQGYWQNPEATQEVIDEDGWLHTGDVAHIDNEGHIFIVGRIKEIIVLGNGEKVPPADIETAIITTPLFEQVMIVGEGKPYLAALVVLNAEHWKQLATKLKLDPEAAASLQDKAVLKTILKQIAQQTKDFPGYAQIRRVHLLLEPWTIDNSLLTPTLKIRRPRILAQYEQVVEAMYEGFEVS